MHWLSSPKVRLALIVNGLYFISFFTTSAPRPARPHLFARANAVRSADWATPAAPRPAPVFATLPPPSPSSKAAALVVKGFDQLDVYLTDDLTLVRRPGYRLLLSPTFTTRASKPVPPETVLFRFVTFSNGQAPSNAGPVMITADGVDMLDKDARWYGGGGGAPTLPNEQREVVRGVGVEISYESFLEALSARQVIIQFGPDRVELTADQIEALRDMHRRLPQPPPPDDSNSH